MYEIDHRNAGEYLQSSGRMAVGEPTDIVELSGGVSNIVLLVALPNRGQTFVLKQARGRLRVKEEWLCPVERIWREMDVVRICGELLRESSPGSEEIKILVPRVLWEDRGNYAYAMTAAPADHTTWKELLL